MKRIGYIGNFGVSFSTESHIAATLEEMGNKVTRLQENQVTAEEVQRRLGEFEMILWTKTGDWFKGDAMEMLRLARGRGIPTVGFHLDLFAPIARNGEAATPPWGRMDYVFTADGGSDEFWKRLGIRHVWSPPGVYGAECYMANVPIRRDVLFVGQYRYHPEWKYRPELIDWLKGTYGERFHHFGHSHETTVRGHDLNRLYASSKVVVGDSLCLNFDHPYYWSDRVPETLGRGGFLIMPEIEGLRDWFTEDELVTYRFGDFDGLKEKIDYYLTHDKEREKIRKAGHEAVKRHSTYHHRMEAMLWMVFGAPEGAINVTTWEDSSKGFDRYLMRDGRQVQLRGHY